MKKVLLLIAVIFCSAAAFAQTPSEAFNTGILAGRSSALAVVDGTGEDARFQSITSMWGDATSLYVADAMTIRRVDLATAQVTTFSRTAGTGLAQMNLNSGFNYNYSGLYGLWSDGVSLYGTDIGAGQIRKIDLRTGGVQTVSAGLSFPWGLYGIGTTLYVDAASSGNVMQVNAVNGTVSQLASAGSGTPRNCFLGSGCLGYFVPGPRSMWSDGQSLFLTGYSGTVKKLALASGEQTFFPSAPFNIGPITGAAGQLFVASISGTQIGSIRLDTGDFTSISFPSETLPITALWSDGANLYAAQHSAIRRVDLFSGTVTVFAGVLETSEFANGIGGEARFQAPQGIWNDGGTLYVADSGNFSIRSLDIASGSVSQVAGTPGLSASKDGVGTNAAFISPPGVWNDGTSLYVTDANCIRRIALDSTAVTTIAGTCAVSGARDGVGADAQFKNPSGLWGRNGILYIADTGNGVIRQLDTATNTVTTLAGAFQSFGTIDGPLESARLRVPAALWGDGSTLYVADLYSLRAISFDTRMVRTVATLRTFSAIHGVWGSGNSLYTFALTGSPLAHLYLYRVAIDTGQISQALHGGADAETGLPIFLSEPYGISGNNSDLFITSRENVVRRLSRVPLPPLMKIQVTDPGYISRTTTGAASTLSAGYARITADAGSVTPAGFAVLALRQNGVLISEASVPAAHAIRSGRIVASAGGPVNTGIAIMNPGSSPAVISFYFTDAAGQNSHSGSFTLAPGAQMARFLTEDPFKGADTIDGTFTFASPVPVSAIALRGYVNERSEFLMTTLPVVDLSNSSNAPVIVTHFASGGGWTTDLALVNPSDQPISGTLQVIGASTGALASSTYSIAARGSQHIRFQVSPGTTTGAIRANPQNGVAPSAICIFSFSENGVRVTEAGVPDVPVASAFHVYTEESGDILHGAPGAVRSGLAMTNPSSTPVDVIVESTDAQGSTFFPSKATVHLDAASHVALFVDESPLAGTIPFTPRFLRVSSPGPHISVVGLRGHYNERGDFLITTTQAIPEDSVPDTQPLYFAHVVDGGGYTTQFILFPATAQASGTSMSATVEYFGQSGIPMVLTTQ